MDEEQPRYFTLDESPEGGFADRGWYYPHLALADHQPGEWPHMEATLWQKLGVGEEPVRVHMAERLQPLIDQRFQVPGKEVTEDTCYVCERRREWRKEYADNPKILEMMLGGSPLNMCGPEQMCDGHYQHAVHDSKQLSHSQLPVKGWLQVLFKAMDDPFIAIVKDKVLYAGYYASFRGGMFQAGAAVSSDQSATVKVYHADNFSDGGCLEDWVPTAFGSINGSLGIDALFDFDKASNQGLFSGPNTMWEDAMTKEEWKEWQKAQFEAGVKGYNAGEARVRKRAEL